MSVRRRTRRRVASGSAVLALIAFVLLPLAFALAVAARERSTQQLSARAVILRDSLRLHVRAAPWWGSDLRLEYSTGRSIAPAACDSGSCARVR